jgi:hypothetical protein
MHNQDRWRRQVLERADQRLKHDTEKQEFDFSDPEWMDEQIKLLNQPKKVPAPPKTAAKKAAQPKNRGNNR